jgi:hypothetical protein
MTVARILGGKRTAPTKSIPIRSSSNRTYRTTPLGGAVAGAGSGSPAIQFHPRGRRKYSPPGAVGAVVRFEARHTPTANVVPVTPETTSEVPEAVEARHPFQLHCHLCGAPFWGSLNLVKHMEKHSSYAPTRRSRPTRQARRRNRAADAPVGTSASDRVYHRQGQDPRNHQ